MFDMPPRSKLKLPPLDLGKESIGGRLSRLRKERGLSQIELASRMGIIQQLITDYERDRLRLHAEMVIRFAQALEISTDELLLGSRAKGKAPAKMSLKLVKRLQKIEKLPAPKQRALLQTIDGFLQGTALHSV